MSAYFSLILILICYHYYYQQEVIESANQNQFDNSNQRSVFEFNNSPISNDEFYFFFRVKTEHYGITPQTLF